MTVITEQDETRARPWRLALAASVPLFGVALAYALWWISDRLVYIGPFDRAQFGWLVVVPVWALTPVVAAYAWRPMGTQPRFLVAAIIGLVLSIVAAVLFFAAVAFPDCAFGATRTAADWVVPSIVVGLVIGAGFAAICLLAARVLDGGTWWLTLVAGSGAALALVFVAIFMSALFLTTGACQRSPMS